MSVSMLLNHRTGAVVRRGADAFDPEAKPGVAGLLGPAALAGAALVGARLLNLVAVALG